MKYISELEELKNEMFDSSEACEAAEAEVMKKRALASKAGEELLSDKQDVILAYKEMNAVQDECKQKIKEARDRFRQVQDRFIDKHGSCIVKVVDGDISVYTNEEKATNSMRTFDELFNQLFLR